MNSTLLYLKISCNEIYLTFYLKIFNFIFFSRLKRAAGGKKSSVQHSSTDVTEMKDGRRKKEKREEKNTEDKVKFCKTGS